MAMCYEALANQVASFVSERLDGPITLPMLAEHVGVSKYHLNRVFEAATGFSLGEYIQRRRMLRAFHSLAESQASVLEVALMVGYESHSAFSRAFYKSFKRQPSDVRSGESPAAYAGPSRPKPAVKMLQPRVLDLVEQRIPGLYGQGFDENSFAVVANRLFAQIYEALERAGIGEPGVARVGVSLDNPWQGDQSACRFFAGIDLADPVPGLSDEFIQQAGRWARFTHCGEYRLIWQTVSQIYAGWVLPNAIELKDQAIVQRYLNDPRDTAPDDLLTELFFAF